MIPTCDKCGKKWRVLSQKENDSVRLIHKCPTNPYLTPTMRKIMQMIVDSDDKELAYFEPGGWWVGPDKVKSAACIKLLRLCLIKPIWESSGDHYYRLTEEAFETFKNPMYVPLIIQELKKLSKE